MRVDLNNLAKAPVSKKFFKEIARIFFRTANTLRQYDISIALVDNATIKKLNKTYRGMNEPTDVLSFSEHDSKIKMFLEPRQLGEIIISYPMAVSQAKRFKISTRDELRTLFVHGLAHLLGYEHNTYRAARKMKELESRVLGKLNLNSK